MTIIQNLGLVPYEPTMAAMQAFTEQRTADTPDEIWVCQHTPVFTQGLAGKADHVLFNPDGPDHIPVVQTNRGGQVTYHGPGQIVAYPLLDLRRRGYFVKEYVYRLEEAVIRTLTLENACHDQVLCLAMDGDIVEFEESDIESLRANLDNRDQYVVNFDYLARKAKKRLL